MTAIQTILGGAAAKATGWALLHVLWQASLIAAVLGVALVALRNRSANARYVAACIALFATITLPVATGIASFEAMPDKNPLMSLPAVAPVAMAGFDAGAAEIPLRAPTLRERIASLPVEPALPWVVAIWLAGVALLSMRIAYGLISVSRMGRLGTSPVAPSIEHTMHELAELMELRRAVRILRSRRIEVPTVIGWIEPVILVPVSALSGLTPHQLRTILAHELAHVRRHDFAVNLVQTAVETLLFFHPAVWWISRQVRVEREHCCDDIAVSICGDPIGYARALATMEELRAEMLPAVAATGGSLSARIRRLLGVRSDESEAVRPAIAVAAALAVTMAAVLPLFAGSYIYRSVTSQGPGERIVVIADADEDLDVLVDSVIDARLAAADAGLLARQIQGEQLARLDAMSDEIARAQSLARGLPDDQMMAAARELADAARFRAFEMDAFTEAAAEGRAEAEKLAAFYSSYGFTITPVAPVAPVAVTPQVPAVAPVPPVPPIAPVLALSLSDMDDRLMLLDRAAGEKPLDLDNPTVDDLIFLKRHGIDATYIRAMQAAGLNRLTARELASLRSNGVSPATVSEMRSQFGNDLSTRAIVAMASLGIDAGWVREMRATGMTLTALDAIRMKSLGIDGQYASSIRGAGYRDITASELARLKSMEIDGAWIREINATRGETLSVPDLIRLKSAGIDADYLRNWK